MNTMNHRPKIIQPVNNEHTESIDPESNIESNSNENDNFEFNIGENLDVRANESNDCENIGLNIDARGDDSPIDNPGASALDLQPSIMLHRLGVGELNAYGFGSTESLFGSSQESTFS